MNFIFFSVEGKERATYISELTCEYKKDPLGIGISNPRLSWKIYSSVNDQTQTSYQVLVASSPQLLSPDKADLWDSKKVDSDQSTLVEYDGKTLESRQRCYWTVRIWDKGGNLTSWAKPAYFEIGLLHPTDWVGDWIKTAFVFDGDSYPAPLFRKNFYIEKKIKSARLYCTSRGLYEFYLNGKRVGNQFFTPGWTSFEKRLQYQVFNVTEMFRTGENVAGIMLGNGWYRAFGPNYSLLQEKKDLEVLAQIEIEFTDGSKQYIKTNNSWKSSTGAVLKSEIYYGEIYDARLEKTGWNNQGFDDSDWKDVLITQRSKNHLVSTISEPVKKIQEITPVKIIYTPQGDTVLDMGQNMVGWCRLKVECPKGTTIKLRHAEVLDKNGNFYVANLRSAKQEIIYTCKGESGEEYEPHFTFQGFRYVAISGYPQKVTKDIIKGIVVHSDLERSGSFSCNDSLINQLQHNIIWGQKGNFIDVPTDCPQRNERLGWTGDAQLFSSTACFNFQSANFYTKWLYDLAADQFDNGIVPNVIPNVFPNEGGSSGWADAAIIVPWNLYCTYGDIRILDKQYDSMKRWVEYMRSQVGDTYIYKSKNPQFGDWLAFATTQADYPGATTDKDFLSTAYFYHSASLLQKIAGILEKTADSTYFLVLQEKIKEAFYKEYITINGRLSPNTQTAYVVALTFGLLPSNLEKCAAARLSENVQQLGHLTTGLLGTPDLCNTLSKYGYLNEAYMLLYRKEYPSWLYPITKGATTIWERWDGIKPDGTFQTPRMNSFNHYVYGAIGNWLYKVVAGINPDMMLPGYKHIIIKPYPANQINDVCASHESLYGTIVSQWKIQDKKIQLTVEVPPNTTAEVFIPSTGNTFSRNGESGLTGEIEETEGIPWHFLKTEIGSGKYVFETNYVPND